MIPLKKYRWLLFDLDNTLIDFHEPSRKSFDDLISHFRIASDLDLYKTYQLENKKVWNQYEEGTITSRRLRSLRFEYFFTKLGVTHNPMEAHDQYVSGLIKYSVLPSKVRSMLESLSRSHKLAIITNGLKEAQRPRLKATGLDLVFDKVIVSDEIDFAKPQKAFFDYVIEHIGFADKEKMLIIGDSLMSDILGGNLSGIDTVWLNADGQQSHSKVVPTYIISKLQELIQ